MAELVKSTINERSARIELCRPEAGNRITVAMMRQFAEALEAATSADADVLVISALGEHFTLGRDQQEGLPPGMTRRDSLALAVHANGLLAGFPGITLTAAQGKALGYGSGLVVQSDLAVAADTATLGFDEIRHGFAPLVVLTYLEHFVGPKRALDLVLTGRHLNAGEAERFGMVTRVVPADDLEACTESLAGDLLSHDRTALRRCKQYLAEIRTVAPAQRGEYALDQMTRGS